MRNLPPIHFSSRSNSKFLPYSLLSASEYPSAHFLTSAPEGMFHHPKDSPHARFNVPAETSRTIQIITGAGSPIFQFHVKTVSNTDSSLKRNFPGQIVFQLFSPQMSVNSQGYISWLICRHHGPEDHPVSGIRLIYWCRRISMYLAAEYFPHPRITGKPVGKPL